MQRQAGHKAVACRQNTVEQCFIVTFSGLHVVCRVQGAYLVVLHVPTLNHLVQPAGKHVGMTITDCYARHLNHSVKLSAITSDISFHLLLHP